MTESDAPILTITDAAREVVREARAEEATEGASVEDLALYVEITGISGTAFTYDMYFQPVAEAGAAGPP